MGLTVTVTPGKRFASTEKITIPKLNQLGMPTFAVTGQVATGDLADASVTGDKTVPSDHFYADTVAFAAGDFTLGYTPTPPLIDGMIVAFKATANGVPDATNGIRIVIGGASKKLFKHKTEPLKAGDIVLNQIVEARYEATGDGGAGAWQMTSHRSTALVLYSGTVTGTNAYAAVLTPPASYPMTLADLTGKVIRLTIPNANTGGCTLALTVGGTILPTKPLLKNFNLPLLPNDLRQNQVIDVVYEPGTVAVPNDTFQMLSPVGNVLADTAVIASSRNLVMRSLSTTQAVLLADELVLKNNVGAPLLVKNLNITMDINIGVGLDAFETGAARGVSRWFYVWVISDANNSHVVLEDAGSGDGAMPGGPDLTGGAFAGYIYMALVGQIRLNATGSGEIVNFVQYDRAVWIDETQLFTSQIAAADIVWEALGGTPLTAFRSCVPPTGRSCAGTLGLSVAGNLYMSVAGCNSDGTVNLTNPPGVVTGMSASVLVQNGWTTAHDYNIPVRGAANRNIQWRAIRPDATGRARLMVSSYTF